MKVKVEYSEGAGYVASYCEEWFEEFESIVEMVAFMKKYEERFPDAEVSFHSDGILSICREL